MASTERSVTPEQIDVAASAIGRFIRHTPIIEVPGSEIGVDVTLVLKLEYLQHSGSFKGRGASHFLATQRISDTGVVAASGGNHGAAVAWAAHRFGHEAHIFVPTTANPAKVARLHDYGAKVRQVGAVYSEALAAAEQFLAARMATSIHAYDDPIVMAGAGTCARELDRAAPHLDAVIVACGGGGLSGSTAAWYGDRSQIVVVETTGTATYAAALEHGGPIDIDVSGVATDALGATRLGAHPWDALSDAGAHSVLVSDDHVLAARELLWKWLRIVVEPAAAAPIAALTTGAWRPEAPGDRVGVVICGANTALDVATEHAL